MGRLRVRGSLGFTLIELLVVILVIGILIAVAAPTFLGQTAKAYDSQAEQNLRLAYDSSAASSVSASGTGISAPVWAIGGSGAAPVFTNGGDKTRFSTDGTPDGAAALATLVGNDQPSLSVAAGPSYDSVIGMPANYVVIDNRSTGSELAEYVQSQSGTIWCLVANDRSFTISDTSCPPATGPITGGGGGGGGGSDYPLSVYRQGSGTVTSSGGSGSIDCGSTCQDDFTSGDTVNLSATAASGYTFLAWAGACTGSSSCSVTMDSAESVTAIFVRSVDFPPPHTGGGGGTIYTQEWLDVGVQGQGLVTSDLYQPGSDSGTTASPVSWDPSTISCLSACSEEFEFNAGSGLQTVKLTAHPAKGYHFDHWEIDNSLIDATAGDGSACQGNSSPTCTVTLANEYLIPIIGVFTKDNSGGGNNTVANPCGISGDTPQNAGGAPANDDIENATAISGDTGSTNGTLVRASLQSGEASGGPTASDGASSSVWYCYTPSSSGDVTFSTQGSDALSGGMEYAVDDSTGNTNGMEAPMLTIYNTGISNWSDVTSWDNVISEQNQNTFSDDGTTFLEWTNLDTTPTELQSGQTYLISVTNGDWSSGAPVGPFKLSWEPTPPPDFDGDGIPDSTDNCPYTYNPDQANTYTGDVPDMGDACSPQPIDHGTFSVSFSGTPQAGGTDAPWAVTQVTTTGQGYNAFNVSSSPITSFTDNMPGTYSLNLSGSISFPSSGSSQPGLQVKVGVCGVSSGGHTITSPSETVTMAGYPAPTPFDVTGNVHVENGQSVRFCIEWPVGVGALLDVSGTYAWDGVTTGWSQ